MITDEHKGMLAGALCEAGLDTHDHWTFSIEYPGYFCYSSSSVDHSIFCTPGWESSDDPTDHGIAIEVQAICGETMHCALIPWTFDPRDPLTSAREFFKHVAPFLGRGW